MRYQKGSDRSATRVRKAERGLAGRGKPRKQLPITQLSSARVSTRSDGWLQGSCSRKRAGLPLPPHGRGSCPTPASLWIHQGSSRWLEIAKFAVIDPIAGSGHADIPQLSPPPRCRTSARRGSHRNTAFQEGDRSTHPFENGCP